MMSDVESIVNFGKWFATTFWCLFHPRFLPIWKFQRFQNHDWLSFVWSWHEEMEVLARNQYFLCNVQIQPLPYPQKLTHHLSHKVQEWVFHNLTTAKSDEWFDLIHVLTSGITCNCIVLPLGILLWLRWKLTFLLKTESRCEFCKSIFKICHALSQLSVDCLLLFNECMQSFLKISSRRGNIRRCISIRILKIIVCLKLWLWSLCIIVTTLPTEIWVISPTGVICLWVWVMIGLLETV